MKTKEFEIGNEVIFVKNCSNRCKKGMKGIVVNFTSSNNPRVKLEFSNYISGGITLNEGYIEKIKEKECTYEIY